jgi:hypothetical protein
MYTKYGELRSSSLSFMNEVLSLVPDKDIEEVKYHLAFYKQQINLNMNKKKLIKQYKIVLKRSRTATAKIESKPSCPLPPKRSSSKSAQYSKQVRAQQRETIDKWKKEKENEQ